MAKALHEFRTMGRRLTIYPTHVELKRLTIALRWETVKIPLRDIFTVEVPITHRVTITTLDGRKYRYPAGNNSHAVGAALEAAMRASRRRTGGR